MLHLGKKMIEKVVRCTPWFVADCISLTPGFAFLKTTRTVPGRFSIGLTNHHRPERPSCSNGKMPSEEPESKSIDGSQQGASRDISSGGSVSTKRELRRAVKALLRASGIEDEQKRRTYSDQIALQLIDDLDILGKTRAMTLYIASERLLEVDTSRILDHAFSKNIHVYLPRVLDRDGAMHFLQTFRHDTYNIVPPFDIQEPTEYMPDGVTRREDICATERQLDLMIVPGLAFGEGGERLGRGGGYYDTFISTYIKKKKNKPFIVGIAFDEQIVQGIPMDVHDHRVDMIVTPTRVIDTTK